MLSLRLLLLKQSFFYIFMSSIIHHSLCCRHARSHSALLILIQQKQHQHIQDGEFSIFGIIMGHGNYRVWVCTRSTARMSMSIALCGQRWSDDARCCLNFCVAKLRIAQVAFGGFSAARCALLAFIYFMRYLLYYGALYAHFKLCIRLISNM